MSFQCNLLFLCFEILHKIGSDSVSLKKILYHVSLCADIQKVIYVRKPLIGGKTLG